MTQTHLLSNEVMRAMADGPRDRVTDSPEAFAWSPLPTSPQVAKRVQSHDSVSARYRATRHASWHVCRPHAPYPKAKLAPVQIRSGEVFLSNSSGVPLRTAQWGQIRGTLHRGPGARVSPLCRGFPVLARVTYRPIHWPAEGFSQAPPAPAVAPFPKALRPAHRLQTKHPL